MQSHDDKPVLYVLTKRKSVNIVVYVQSVARVILILVVSST
jgi:hypothetical protein